MRVALIENSVRGKLTTYRPITVYDILYRMFTKLLGKHIQDWSEETKQLSEMQNGFRRGRRGEDNLFILTSAIECARTHQETLKCVFVDAKEAHDRINRHMPRQTLGERDL